MEINEWYRYCGFNSFDEYQEYMINRIIEVSKELNKDTPNRFTLMTNSEAGCMHLPITDLVRTFILPSNII